MIIVAKTDKGRVRAANQDSCFVSEGEMTYLAVADGMGGHKAGEVASATAIEAVRSFLTADNLKKYKSTHEFLSECSKQANVAVYSSSCENPDYEGMGTTLVIAYLEGNKAFVTNVGDSRAYMIRNNEISQVSVDHSVVQGLFESGQITRSEMRTHPKSNLITRVIGTKNTVECDIFELELKSDDVILLCSDGLNGMLEDEEILDIYTKSSDLNEFADELINGANNAGGTDNITVAVLKF